MTINVTQRDIDSGHPCHCYKCPIARAVKRAAKAKGLKGTVTVIYPMICIGKRKYTLPNEAYLFMKNFDECCFVEPIRFKIDRYINMF